MMDTSTATRNLTTEVGSLRIERDRSTRHGSRYGRALRVGLALPTSGVRRWLGVADRFTSAPGAHHPCDRAGIRWSGSHHAHRLRLCDRSTTHDGVVTG